jgi:hypothetical protein
MHTLYFPLAGCAQKKLLSIIYYYIRYNNVTIPLHGKSVMTNNYFTNEKIDYIKDFKKS